MAFRRNKAPSRPSGAKFGGNKRFGDRGGFSARGGSAFGGGARRGGDDDQPPRVYPAVCAKCGKTTEVPFRPNGSKPVYCRSCFRPNETGSREKFSRPTFGAKRPQEAAAPRPHDGQIEKRLAEIDSKLEFIIRELQEIRGKEL